MMAVGCLLGVCLWLLVVIAITPNGLFLVGLALLGAGVIALIDRWLRSDWPLI